MKRQSMKCTQRGSALVWTDRTSGYEFLSFDMDGVAEELRAAVYAYGVRQIIADGGADADSHDERIAKMTARARTLVDGTWGTRKSALVDGDVFNAAVWAGLVPDTEAARVKWAALKPAQRRAIADREDVRVHMPQVSTNDTDSILDSF